MSPEGPASESGGVVVVDFGAQYSRLIARRVREVGVFSRIVPFDTPAGEILSHSPAGVILSGGPMSVLSPGAPDVDPKLWDAGVPVLGICYGAQLMAHVLGGKVHGGGSGGYGRSALASVAASTLLCDLAAGDEVWMSHGDAIVAAPAGAVVTAGAADAPVAAFEDSTQGRYGVQFHPEVVHTPKGRALIERFCLEICGAQVGWDAASIAAGAIEAVRRQVGEGRVLCALSGGVDSSVAAALVHKAVGDRLTCVFVDTGLMREGEGIQVEEAFRARFGVDLVHVRAAERFFSVLAGVEDPEHKRKAIGETFIRIFEEVAAEHSDARYLVQGTLYPDVIESGTRDAARIKSHHNVGGLPADMRLELVEPLRLLFKDEVRSLGEELGLPPEMVWRQPFPGPGLAVRIIGEVTPERVEIVRAADTIVSQEIAAAGLTRELWQAFTVLPALRTVGVMGDERTYAYPIAIRAVKSEDAMTADWARLPWELLERCSSRIINEVTGVNRVVYDVTSKPPGTIEWE